MSTISLAGLTEGVLYSDNCRPVLPILKCLSEEQQRDFLQEFVDAAMKEKKNNTGFNTLLYMLTKE